MNRAEIEEPIDRVLASLARGEPVAAVPLTFLLRCYGASNSDAIRGALEPALACALDEYGAARTIDEQAEWLVVFADAAAMSTDDRLVRAARDLMTAVRREWGRSRDIAQTGISTEACLRASRLDDVPPVVPEAIEELERVVATAYQPGRGLSVGPDRSELRLADQVRMASALLVAYEVCGRLPYAMLAEELMQVARRMLWNDASGGFLEPSLDRDAAFRLNCDAAGVLCGLATLHDDGEYQSAAVICEDAAYGDAAERILAAHEPESRDSCARSAAYGLALLQYLRLRIED